MPRYKQKLDDINALKKKTIEELKSLESDYILASDETKKRLSEFNLLLEELNKLKKVNIDADDKPLEIPTIPNNASYNIKSLESNARTASDEEHYAHWSVLSHCISVAEEIFNETNHKNTTVLNDDIKLLKSAVTFSQEIISNPEFRADEKYNEKYNAFKKPIQERINNYDNYYNNNKMPFVWGGLLIALGVLTIVAAFIAEAAILAALGPAGIIPAAAVAFGGLGAGLAMIATGSACISLQMNKLSKDEPIISTKLSQSVHGLHSQQKTRIEKTEELNKKLNPNK